MKSICLSCIISILLIISINAYAEGLSTLAKVGKSQDAMARALNEETKQFKDLKDAIERGAIKKGESQEEIKARYGEPVIAIAGKDNTEKWVYKPGYATWFDGIKIYLFFDSDKKLHEIKGQLS